ncbi:RodZ domain-containing protein [Paratractidigestivibacter faecalis]|uniref:RodZ domain-containing protein n=1 Tax=Paratractidigestivibacter faecalis TaxID=2292441 RepID=UPI003CFFA14F
MPRPRFSEMLLQRRRQLGLTCEQASRILKLREDVLIAFEEGDFESMPQSGYAQGMLSSYARYLGLNAREVVDLFQEELYEYVNGSGSHELRRRTRDTIAGRGISGYDVVNEAGSRPKAYVEYHGLLPTAGGPAGDMGNFATVTPARPRQSVPLAGLGPSAVAAYGREDHAHQQPRQQRPYNSGQAYESRQQRSTARRRASGQRRPQSDPAGRLLREGQQGVVDRDRDLVAPRGRAGQARTQRLYQRDDVSTRSVRRGEYRDDLRYDGVASPYERASTISGRRSSRNIASVERPNVRRRQPSERSGAQGGRRRQPARRGGVAGFVDAFLSDRRRALLLLLLVLAAVLTLILVFSVKSCTGSAQSAQTGSKTVNVTTAQGSGQDSSQGSGSGSDASSSASDSKQDQAASDASGSGSTATGDAASGDQAQADAAATPERTVVQVSLASGEASWVEVTVDGKSVVADNLTGAWSQTYTVTDSIAIQVSNVDAVTVTNNGKKVDFSSKTSGVGTLTIKGTPAPATDETGGDASADSSAGTSGTSSSASAASTKSSGSKSQ